MNRLQKIFLASSALAFLSFSTPALSAEKEKLEKCVGIVKTGQADGQTIVDGNKMDWILVPAGACTKLVGGVVILDE